MSGAPTTYQAFLQNVYTYILYPVLSVTFAAALMLFIYGLLTFIRKSDSDDGRETGKRHMIWGVLGMTLMFCAYALVQAIQGTVTNL